LTIYGWLGDEGLICSILRDGSASNQQCTQL